MRIIWGRVDQNRNHHSNLKDHHWFLLQHKRWWLQAQAKTSTIRPKEQALPHPSIRPPIPLQSMVSTLANDRVQPFKLERHLIINEESSLLEMSSIQTSLIRDWSVSTATVGSKKSLCLSMLPYAKRYSSRRGRSSMA